MNQQKSILILLFVFVFSNSVFSQYTDVINSNRPGVSKSAFSVGKNVVQFEVGPYMVNEKRVPTVPYKVSGFGADFSLRYGLLWEQLEINVEGIYQNDTKTTNSFIEIEQKRANFKHLTLGAKYLIFDPYKDEEKKNKPNLYSWNANHTFKWRTLLPAVALYAGANYDTKDNPYIATGVEGISPKVMLSTQNNFAGGWVFVMNFVGDRIGTEQFDLSYILTLTYPITEQLVIFGETQGIKSDFYADNLFRFGGAYLLTKDIQFDTALTFNAKDTPSVLNANIGFSYRLDFHKDPEADNGTSFEDQMKRGSNKKSKKKKKGNDSGTQNDVIKRQRDSDFGF